MGHLTKYWAGIHKTDQAQVKPKISSSLQLFILNLSWFLAKLELDPFVNMAPGLHKDEKILPQPFQTFDIIQVKSK